MKSIKKNQFKADKINMFAEAFLPSFKIGDFQKFAPAPLMALMSLKNFRKSI